MSQPYYHHGTADEYFCSNDKVEETAKRCSSTSPDSAPPHKSPRIEDQFPTTQTSNVEEPSGMDQNEVQADNTDESSDHAANPATRRKSFRRATMTRRSLPALPNQYQGETSGVVAPLELKKKEERKYLLHIVLHCH